MKDNQVHDHLDEKEIRDFFAKKLYDAFWNRKFMNNELERRMGQLLEFKSFDYTIERSKLDIEIAEAKIEEAQTQKTLLILMKERGWQEWDVSDETKKSQVDAWLSFIGTEEEYKDLLEP